MTLGQLIPRRIRDLGKVLFSAMMRGRANRISRQRRVERSQQFAMPGGIEFLEDRALLAFNLTIDAATTSGGSFSGGVFTPTGNDAVANTADIEALLDAGTSVTINTGGGGAQDGDIQVVAALEKTAGGNAGFTLQAANNINVAAAITSTAGALGVTLTAASGVTLSGANGDVTTGGGTFTVDADSDDNGTGIYSQDNAGSAVSTAGGAVSITAASVDLVGTINSGTGSTSLIPSGSGTDVNIGGIGQAAQVFWTDSTNDKIYISNPGGTTVTELPITGSGTPMGIALDTVAGKVYWTDILQRDVFRANVAGALNQERLINDSTSP